MEPKQTLGWWYHKDTRSIRAPAGSGWRTVASDVGPSDAETILAAVRS